MLQQVVQSCHRTLFSMNFKPEKLVQMALQCRIGNSMVLLDSLFGTTPEAFNGVSMHSSDRINEVLGVIHSAMSEGRIDWDVIHLIVGAPTV